MSRFPSFSVFFHIPGPTVCFSQFARFSVFLDIFHDIHFLRLIFHVIHFSPHIQVIECSCLIFQDFQFPRHNPGTTVYIFDFLLYSPFFAINFTSLCVCFSFSMILNFHALLQVLQCAFLICHIFPCFLSPTRSNNVCVSFSMFFSFLAIIQVLECVFLIFHVFDCFWPYPKSYRVCVSFCNFLRFLAIIQVLHCVFLDSMFLTVSRHIPSPTVCFSHIPRFSVFSPYSRSYSVFFSVWKFFSVSHHIPGHTFFKSIFPRYSVFSAHSRS